jgi:hypothetical protein
MKYTIEYTDTYGGEANYTWVKRESFETEGSVPEHIVVRKLKRMIGLTGVNCKKESYGEMIKLTPYGSNTVAFITCEC